MKTSKYLFASLLGLCWLSACSHSIVRTHSNLAPASILLVLAHPDDETMISEFLTKWHQEGHEVHAIYATAGEGGRVFKGLDGQNQPTFGKLSPSRMSSKRLKELKKAAKGFHIRKYEVIGAPDTPLRDTLERPSRDVHLFFEKKIWDLSKIERAITTAAQTIDPTWIVTMSKDQDTHVHHKAIRNIVESLWNQRKIGTSSQSLLLAIDEGTRIDETLGTEEKHLWASQTVSLPKAFASSSKIRKHPGPAKHYKTQMAGYLLEPLQTTQHIYLIDQRAP
ncbi:MAG: PIG-L family deacetylase [Bdellovibrionota bacterium]